MICFSLSTNFATKPGVLGPPRVSGHRATCSRRTKASRMMSSPSPGYHGIQHAGMLVEDTERAKKFYMEVFGMEDDTEKRNPKLPFKGAFLKAGASQIHLMELPSLDPREGRPDHGGRDKHVAITVQNLEPLIESLKKHGRYFTFSKSGRRALFTRDVDANALEFIEEKVDS